MRGIFETSGPIHLGLFTGDIGYLSFSVYSEISGVILFFGVSLNEVFYKTAKSCYRSLKS